MNKLIFPFIFTFLLLSCSKNGDEQGPESIEPQNMTLKIDLGGNYQAYDTQVTVFSWGAERVSVNEGNFQNGIERYRLSGNPTHNFEFEDKLASFAFRIALGLLGEQSVSTEPSVIKVSAYLNGVVFDEQSFTTNTESTRDTIGFVYNALGQQFIEYDSRN